ncbi:Uncharacterized protein APZ42_005770, partial [Daphnia magna]
NAVAFASSPSSSTLSPSPHRSLRPIAIYDPCIRKKIHGLVTRKRGPKRVLLSRQPTAMERGHHGTSLWYCFDLHCSV